MSEQREMTLDEWVNRLPEFHLANKQYQQLRQRNDELAAAVQLLREALRHLYHNAKASGAEMGLGLEVAEDALNSTLPHTKTRTRVKDND